MRRPKSKSRICPGWPCHGRPRRPLEPNGWVAPAVRAVAWALVGVGGFCLMLVALGAVMAWPRPALEALVLVVATAPMVGALLRLIAMFLRPEPLILTLRAPERR